MSDSGTPRTESEGTVASCDQGGFLVDEWAIAVIIPAFNQSQFLAEAIESVLTQTRQADDVIVVDDGSTDDTAAVVAEFPAVRLIRQDNLGPSAARNTGLRGCKTSYIVFLDADDRLLPNALESALACMSTHPDCAFVYGGHRRISEDGHPLGPDVVRLLNGDAHLALLRQNLVGPPMTALFRRDYLLAVNGFDETLRHCEDYDIYLRLARRYPVASYPTLIAEHRMHGQAASNNYVQMLKGGLLVLDLSEASMTADPGGRAAIQAGRTNIRGYYVPRIIRGAYARWQAHNNIAVLVKDLIEAARCAPGLTLRALLRSFGRRTGKTFSRLR